jgi:hypothetical protein
MRRIATALRLLLLALMAASTAYAASAPLVFAVDAVGVTGQKWVFSLNTSHRGPEHVLATWNPARNPVSDDRP